MRCKFSGSGFAVVVVVVEDGRRERIWDAVRGEFTPFCQMASGMLRRTTAFSDIGTLIMLANSRMARRASFRAADVSSASAIVSTD